MENIITFISFVHEDERDSFNREKIPSKILPTKNVRNALFQLQGTVEAMLDEKQRRIDDVLGQRSARS